MNFTSVVLATSNGSAAAFSLDRIVELAPEIWVAMAQTFAMLLVSIPIAILLGTPLGIWLYSMSPNGLRPRPRVHKIVDGLVNTIRSFPFLILLIAIIPFTRFVVGTTIGTAAVIVPLTINAIPYFARFVEQNISQLGNGVVEAAQAMGATRGQIIREVLLVEAKPALLSSITIMTVSFISYSAMAGLVGGGGIGDFAIRYGYYRYETGVMLLAIVLMILLVHAVQFFGTRLSRAADKR
ncbi:MULTISPECIES: methionine ABC transporter permease [Glutamicibacter]|uniref:ABC transporter permease n=1 Tax=Glutamicibacter halophytocola TaxID=1933880 RepID=A0A5B8IYI1_9MICC|nr:MULTISPECIES: methionine ABC transporter permease [Glutamicibacter]ALG27849.1 methionine ABC transporter ATP-binding protein [Glutamicibacter halophytocola]MBF6672017.1 ABC transporter permease [Glutamicibacter sp. FBE19]NQD40924.1 ABC transporter permease [Glutamicibacter halophytocola]QDY67187.1 ABC transporter permease [Glutamicibacter halophytocola]UUX59357.1 ABC transporter permease [Glutamicibacter halophytocola]